MGRRNGDVGLRRERGAAKYGRTTERMVGQRVNEEALEHRPFEPANFLRGVRVDDRDVIGSVDHTAFAFGDVDASIEAEDRRAAVVRSERSGRTDQRGHDEQRKNNRDDGRASAFAARENFSRRCEHDVQLL